MMSKLTRASGILAAGVLALCCAQVRMVNAQVVPGDRSGKIPPQQTAPQSGPGLLLTVEEVDGTKKNGPTGAMYDFGTLSALNPGKIEHSFVLKNDNAQAIVIDRIPPTCGCTTVVLEGANKDKPFPVTVEPGNDIHIHTSIDPGHLYGGSFTKNVLVYLSGQSTPSHTLQLSGMMRQAVSIEPASIEFGRGRTTESRVMTAAISYDPKLLAGKSQPKVTCTVAGIKVKEVKGKDTTAPASAANKDEPGYIVRHYELEIPKHMKIGSFWGQLIVTTTPVMTHPNLGNIHGEVYGDITAEPLNVTFGSVAPDAATPQTVTIVGTSSDAVRDLRVESKNPMLKVTLNPVDPRTPTTRIIMINLDPKVPKGAFQSDLTVRSKQGDEIGVTVMGYVMTPAEMQPSQPTPVAGAQGNAHP